MKTIHRLFKIGSSVGFTISKDQALAAKLSIGDYIVVQNIQNDLIVTKLIESREWTARSSARRFDYPKR